ncbi:MAG: RsmB/NOP family class I SAM-dependent RNA methyltransferase [Alphaproteobacteria bacterium]|nr:RsmB/NOP family class I SAM-dependent RNA methyltransferase [Alphaproteobacteria bacterium]MDE2336424.1 RsmB/NOP family class I SAM-dependent RNA methyltransferase [Alphaproteobacteria bacterium]
MSAPPESAQAEGGHGLAARRAAFSILNDIFFRRRSLDEALAGQDSGGLPARDRAFARLLVVTVLRRARQMDAVLAHFLHEPFDALKPASLINVFRLGMAQLVFLGTPEHAAVNTTVELAAAEGIAHQKALVNAVMRRLAREGFPEMPGRDAGKFNTPEWLWNAWMKDYGVEAALGIAAANLGEAPLDISVKNDPQGWAEKLGATVLPTGSLRKQAGGFIPDMAGYAEGAWWIQNAAAALPAALLGDMRGKAVVDLCAAPGGKTAQLANAGAKVTAVDRSAQRIARLKENMQRLRFEDVETVIADGATWKPAALVDAVLLDAPCTATGTIRHQPDVLHLKEPKDQEKLVTLQRRLLSNAAEMLKPGGTLVYCTCSIQKAEGEEQAGWVLSQGLPLRRVPVTHNGIPELAEMVTEQGEIRCLPNHWQDFGGIDGFFVARFARV